MCIKHLLKEDYPWTLVKKVIRFLLKYCMKMYDVSILQPLLLPRGRKSKGMQNALRVQPCAKWGFTEAIGHYCTLFSLKAFKMPDINAKNFFKGYSHWSGKLITPSLSGYVSRGYRKELLNAVRPAFPIFRFIPKKNERVQIAWSLLRWRHLSGRRGVQLVDVLCHTDGSLKETCCSSLLF